MKLYTCDRRGRAGRKNVRTLEEINSNKEPNAGRFIRDSAVTIGHARIIGRAWVGIGTK